MRIDIFPIRGTKGASLPIDSSLVLDDVLDEGFTVRFLDPIRVSGCVTNTGGLFLLTGRVRGTAELLCDRCMEPFVYRIDSDFAYEYAEDSRDAGESCRRPSESGRDAITGDSDRRQLDGDEIDLSPEVREAVLLALPHKRLCSEECKGICQKCGANLNESPCRCTEDQIDPRLAGLSRLLSD